MATRDPIAPGEPTGATPAAGWVLALDQGTHASRALLFDGEGRERAVASRPVALRRGPGGRVEQDPEELVASCRAVLAEVLMQRPVGAELAACGLATQRSTLVLWDADSRRPVAPAVHWQDTRCADGLGRFEPARATIAELTGLRLSAHYAAPRLHWMLARDRHLQRLLAARRLRCAPLAGYLTGRLLRCGHPALDHANATRTLLFDLARRDWSPALLETFGLPLELLPACAPIRHDYGVLDAAEVPLTAVCGDQNAALYAHGAPPPGTLTVNLGSGAFAVAATGRRPRRHPPLLGGIADSDARGAEYLLEATVNGAGSALHWAAERLGVGLDWPALERTLAAAVEPPLFLNRVGGLGSPWWRAGEDGSWCPGATAAQVSPLLRLAGVLESIVFMLAANLTWLRRAGSGPRRVRLGGGLAASDGLCRRLASLAGVPVVRCRPRQSSARGIAWLAAGRPRGWAQRGWQQFDPAADPGLLARYARFLEHTEQAPP